MYNTEMNVDFLVYLNSPPHVLFYETLSSTQTVVKLEVFVFFV